MTIESIVIHEPNLKECVAVMRDTRELCLAILQQPDSRARSAKLLNANLARLRHLHRNMYMVLRQRKQDTAEARQEQDRLHLQLQNLYYEQKHLRTEIDACLEYPHEYVTIPLVSEEEYLDRHPDATENDPHELMKDRLYDERAAREQLEAQRKVLVGKKQTLIAENKRRKEDLASLDEQLKRFIESSKTIQQTFEKDY